MSFHRAVRNHVLLVYPREIFVLDLEVGQTIGCVLGGTAVASDGVCDGRSNGGIPPIFQVYPCSQRDAIFLLHENGAVSLRARQGIFKKAAVSRGGSSNMTRSISMTSSLMSPAGDVRSVRDSLGQNMDTFRDSLVLEVCYELKGITSDVAIKLGGGAKGTKVNY